MRRNLLLAAASVVIFLGLAEAALRFSGKVPTGALRSPCIETLNRIPGLFEPGQDLVDRIRPDLPYRIHINALGFRGSEFAAGKEPGVTRVLCVGDSYTFGHHVEDEEAFPAVLHRALRAVPPPGAEAINGGANGFTITDELIFIKEKGLGLDPDVVVLAFSQNDILDLARGRPMIEMMREHAELKGTFLLGPILRFLQRTALFNGMQRTAALLAARRRGAETAVSGRASEELWERYRDDLAEAARLLDGRGIRLLLVAWPSADQVAGRAGLEPQERLSGLARQLGVEYLDLFPALRRAQVAGANPYLAPRDGHPSAEGHAAAARAIAERLDGLGFLLPRGRAHPSGRGS